MPRTRPDALSLPLPRLRAFPDSPPHRIAHHRASLLVSFISLVRDGDLEHVTRGPIPLVMPEEEERSKVFWILRLVGIGEAVEFIFPETIDGDGGGSGKVRGPGWTDVHFVCCRSC